MTGDTPGPGTGRTLTDLVREHGTVAPAETMRILAEAADTLDFAHGKRLAHRALTADSIRVDAAGTVRLTGLAVGTSDTAAETAVINADAEFTEADADADVHALAAVGYLCLTGRQLDRAAPQPFPPHVPPVVTHPLWLSMGVQPDTRTPSAERFAKLCRGALAGLGITLPLRPAAAPPQSTAPSGPLPGSTATPPPGAAAPSGATSHGPPPPDALAPPKRRRYLLLAGGVTAAVAVVVAVVLLAVLQPWARGSQALAGGDADGDATLSSSSAEPDDAASRSAADKSESSSASPSDPDSAGAGDGDDDGGDDGGGGGNDGGGGDGGEDDPYSGPMPDVVGMTVEQAYGAIVSEAWIQTDVDYSSTDPTCIVHSQTPAPGTHLDENSNPGITADGSTADCGF